MIDNVLPDNDGYYQEVDEAIYDYDKNKEISDVKIKHKHDELPWKDERLVELGERCNSLTKKGRREYIEERDKIYKERQVKYAKDLTEGTYADLPDSMVFCKCKKCGGGFVAKKADRKRGWARFCSKSCKASY